jgi:predicted RNase H-like nuclease
VFAIDVLILLIGDLLKLPRSRRAFATIINLKLNPKVAGSIPIEDGLRLVVILMDAPDTPCRQAVYAEEYITASNINDEVMGNKLSRQSFAITPKIREVDSFLQEHPEWKNRLLESHPEYCFALLNNGEPILENKQTTEGIAKRMEVLGRYYPNTYEVVQLFRCTYATLSKKVDDLLDALSQALIGAIGLKYGFVSVPENPGVDSHGIKMQIVGASIPV